MIRNSTKCSARTISPKKFSRLHDSFSPSKYSMTLTIALSPTSLFGDRTCRREIRKNVYMSGFHTSGSRLGFHTSGSRLKGRRGLLLYDPFSLCPLFCPLRIGHLICFSIFSQSQIAALSLNLSGILFQQSCADFKSSSV